MVREGRHVTSCRSCSAAQGIHGFHAPISFKICTRRGSARARPICANCLLVTRVVFEEAMFHDRGVPYCARQYLPIFVHFPWQLNCLAYFWLLHLPVGLQPSPLSACWNWTTTPSPCHLERSASGAKSKDPRDASLQNRVREFSQHRKVLAASIVPIR
jgi:hypothetical protein